MWMCDSGRRPRLEGHSWHQAHRHNLAVEVRTAVLLQYVCLWNAIFLPRPFPIQPSRPTIAMIYRAGCRRIVYLHTAHNLAISGPSVQHEKTSNVKVLGPFSAPTIKRLQGWVGSC